MKGLTFRKTLDKIDAFVKQHGATETRRAVLCTYDLHPRTFEALVLPVLTRGRRWWFRTLVLADRAALQRDVVLRQRGATPSYELAPVQLKGPGIFHPKLIMLQADKHVLVGIGSGNLTPGGLGGNLELMLFASNDSVEGQLLASSAIQFLHDLARASYIVIPTSARRFLDLMCTSLSGSEDGPVLHNLDEPLIKQLKAGRPEQVQRVAVVSPWHSSSASLRGVEPAVLQQVEGALGVRPVIYTEGHLGKGPALGKNVCVQVLRPSMPEASEELEDNDEDPDQTTSPPRRPATLHAKAYLAVGKRDATLWFGSANCTSPALLHAANGRGNVEILVRLSLGKRGVAAFEADIKSMFDESTGQLDRVRRTRIPSARGCILSGYMSRWRDQPRLTLELAAPSANARTVHIARSAKRGTAIAVSVPSRVSHVVLDAADRAMLLEGGEAAPVLWEHVGAIPIPFPVSVPHISPIADDPEQLVEDMLYDLAGRVPAAFSSRKRRGRKEHEDAPDEEDLEDGDEQDRELALLTKTDHQGRLDRIAVRVELLRRRLEAAAWVSAEGYAYYRNVIDKLDLAPSLRRILGDHLGTGRRRR